MKHKCVDKLRADSRQTLYLYTYCTYCTYYNVQFFTTYIVLPKEPCILNISPSLFLNSVLAHQLKLCQIQKGLGTSTTSISNWVEGSKATGLFSVACRGCK